MDSRLVRKLLLSLARRRQTTVLSAQSRASRSAATRASSAASPVVPIPISVSVKGVGSPSVDGRVNPTMESRVEPMDLVKGVIDAPVDPTVEIVVGEAPTASPASAAVEDVWREDLLSLRRP